MDAPIDMRRYEGRTIAGRYRLTKYLSEGTFGAVYRASHVAYEVELREVAVKVGKRPMDDSEARRVFGDALMMARLSDAAADPLLRQHFVTVYDAGRCPDGLPLAGHPYVAMEFVPTGSLRRCLAKGPMPMDQAARYFDQLLKALDFMHAGFPGPAGQRRRVVHRDIKPDNILVHRSPAGHDVAKLTDFGLAIQVDDLLGWAESGGDLAYFAPETLSHDRCTPASDIYMAALVFYEMITGCAPFDKVAGHLRGVEREDRAQLRRLHLEARQNERFAMLEQHPQRRQFPAIFELIRGLLASDPASRPCANACELRTAWDRAKSGGAPAAASTPWETARRLTAEAEQCFSALDEARGRELLERAMQLNRDTSAVPPRCLVGKAWLLTVQRLLREKKTEEAIALAHEGHQRRKCRSTLTAMSICYQVQGSPLADRFAAQAHECGDQE